MAQGLQVRDRTTSAILDAAATVIAEHDESASMADVATAAGISRATLYRYFASKEELLRALAGAAIDDVSARLDAADLDTVPVREALARVTRALVACGVKFAVIVEDHRYVDADDVHRRVGDRIRAVFERGIADGTLRGDLPAEVLARLFGALLGGALRSMVQFDGGIERTSAAVCSLFLHGAEFRPCDRPSSSGR
jgi:AcrR family transcriptional regulator